MSEPTRGLSQASRPSTSCATDRLGVVPTRTRCIYSSAEWHTWYRDLLAEMDAFTPADVLARWAKMAAPAYDPVGFKPSEEILAAAPRYKYIEVDGQWWVRDDDAVDKPLGPGISFDVVGAYLRLRSGEIIRDRDTARRRLGKLAGDPSLADLLRAFLTGRQDESRKTMSREIRARAMVVLGLRDAGLSHLQAVRAWLTWECESNGALADRGMCTILESGGRANAVDKQRLKDYQRTVCLTNRRTWFQLGVPVRVPGELAPPL
jgi:hypothetical protein